MIWKKVIKNSKKNMIMKTSRKNNRITQKNKGEVKRRIELIKLHLCCN